MAAPFKLLWKLIVAGFKIVGYTVTGAVEAAWYITHGRRDLLGQVIGNLGQGITDAHSEVLQGQGK